MNNIKEICSGKTFKRLYSLNNIPAVVLNNAIEYLGINNDEIILFYDSSSLNNGKAGLAICSSGVYWKNILCSPKYLTWNTFIKSNLSYDDRRIYIGEKNYFYIYENIVELLSLLKEIKINFRLDNVEEKIEKLLEFMTNTIEAIKKKDAKYNSVIHLTESGTRDIIYLTSKAESKPKITSEELVDEIESVKDILKGFNKYLTEKFINRKATDESEKLSDIIELMIIAEILSWDEDLVDIITKISGEGESEDKNIFQIRALLNSEIEKVERIVYLDTLTNIKHQKISLRKAIKLYAHRIKSAIEEIDEDSESQCILDELYNRFELAIVDFRKSLKKMIKICNSIIEQIYMQ